MEQMQMNMPDMYDAALYLRLSKDDMEEGDAKSESNSIANQRELLRSFVKSQPDIQIFDIYVDDGYSGGNFDRPEFKRMTTDIEAGKVNCVIVKDLSRFGREYIEAGRWIEKTYPALNVRFISVTDQFDSKTADFSEKSFVVPIKNFVNESYCRDISGKVRSHQKIKREKGEFIGAFAHLYWELFSQSISMGLMSSIVSAGSVVLQYGINGLGTLTIAGHTAARKLFAFTDMPLISMANAGSTFVSQNRGANQPDRVRRGMRQMYLYSVVVTIAAVFLMKFGAEWMVRLISGSTEPIVLENGARYLLWNAPFYAVLGVLLCTRYALQSLGQKVLPLFSSVIELVGKVIFVLVFIPKFQYNAVILCEPIIWCFMALYLVLVYLHEPFVFPKKKK